MHKNSLQKAADQAAWSIEQWLVYLSEIHPKNIEMGLERVALVFKRMELDFSHKTVITVAGTNGKGTTCAMIEQALLLQKKRVAVFSSPHLIDYRERLRVQGKMLTPEAHCAAFAAIEHARGDISLTYFEFGTLQALYLMAQSDCDYLLLEVGLGGRLDAVNIIDANIAIITSIDLDHQEWLGTTREAIAVEKAGIFRPNIPVIIGEPSPPNSLIKAAAELNVKAAWQGQGFSFVSTPTSFTWKNDQYHFENLPVPFIPAQNASTALQALSIIGVTLSQNFIEQVFAQTRLSGRRQILQINPTIMLDVAHNPHATRLLANDIAALSHQRVIAVVAMLGDKDIAKSLEPLIEVVDEWYCASLTVPRGAPAAKIVSVLSQANLVLDFASVSSAFEAACKNAQKEDFIVVFGSFYTVAEVLTLVEEN